MSGGSFAQNHLEKYGWEKGKGLGRTETGITDAIKPKLKFDTAGIGHDVGEQFSFHWWDHVFNKAAKNIHVENSEEGVKVKQKGAKANLISNKRTTHENKTKPLLYGSFVKCGTLNPDGAISQDKESSSSSSSDDSDDNDKPPDTYEGNDEMLFKACGGRTAHKGARHGLHLSGKLQRIEEQENLHSNMMKMTKGTKGVLAKDEMEREDNSQNIENRKRNKRKKRTKERNEIEELLDTVGSPRFLDRVDVKEQVQDGEDNVDGGKQSKKKKKSKDKKEIRISENGQDIRIDGTDEVGLSKDMSLLEVEWKEDDNSISTTKSGKKKLKKGKKAKQRTNFGMNEKASVIIEGDEMQDESPLPAGAARKKKSKKEKRKTEIEGEAVTNVELEDEDQNSLREGQRDSKRKRKKDRTVADECIDNDKGKEVESDEELRPKKKKKERKKDEKRRMKEADENNFTNPSSSQAGDLCQDDTISKGGSKKKNKRKSDIYH